MLCYVINTVFIVTSHFFLSIAFRSFVPICSSKTSVQPSWNKSCQQPQRKHEGEGASTLPRTKHKTYSSPTISAKPNISIFSARKPNSSPTLSSLKPKPSDSLHPPTSQWTDPSAVLHQAQPRVSPTLTVPTPRQSPSPTTLYRGRGLDSQGGKHPSSVSKERCARSISISNSEYEPVSCERRFSNEAKHDILDQEALMDFTNPPLRRVCSMTCRESRRQSEPERQAAMSPSSFLLRGKFGSSKNENTDKDKLKLQSRNVDITAILKPNPSIKQQEEFLPSGATGKQTSHSESERIIFANVVQRKSQSVFDGLPIQSSCNLLRESRHYPQSRTAGFSTNDQSYEQTLAERSAALPVTPPVSFSTDCFLNQANTDTRRREFGFNTRAKVDAAFTSVAYLGRPPGENDSQTITGTSSKLFQQTCAPQNISCLLRDMDQEKDAPQCADRLNPLSTCLVVPRTQEATYLASVGCTTLKTTFSKSDIKTHKHHLAHKQHPGPNESHNEVSVSDTGLNQTAEVPTELPECPSEKCVVSWPPSAAQCQFNTNSSKGVFDLPSWSHHRVYHRPDETTMAAFPPPHQFSHSPADRAFIVEEPEDPYYVTMYYPGSVYVGEYRDIPEHLANFH